MPSLMPSSPPSLPPSLRRFLSPFLAQPVLETMKDAVRELGVKGLFKGTVSSRNNVVNIYLGYRRMRGRRRDERKVKEGHGSYRSPFPLEIYTLGRYSASSDFRRLFLPERKCNLNHHHHLTPLPPPPSLPSPPLLSLSARVCCTWA